MGCCLCKQKKEDKIPITEDMHKATLESINRKELIEIKLLKSQLKNDLANHFNNCVKKIIKEDRSGSHNKEKLAKYLYGKIEEHELECLNKNKEKNKNSYFHYDNDYTGYNYSYDYSNSTKVYPQN